MSFGRGARDWGIDLAVGAYQGMHQSLYSMGEWMNADTLYELGEPVLFQAKSQTAYDDWSALGATLADKPLSTLGSIALPNGKEFLDTPSVYTGTKAAADVALLAFTASRLARSTSALKATKTISKTSSHSVAAESLGKNIKPSKRVTKLSPTQGAEGPHSSFKIDPIKGLISGYETYEINPYTQDWSGVKRFRGQGIPHGGQSPPLILEPRPGKKIGGKPVVPREPYPWELPYGY